MKELVIEFYGRVQAVTLRHQLSLIAKNLDLTGFIENKEGGSVYCLVQGSEPSLEEFLQWSQKITFPIKLTGMKFEWHTSIAKSYKNFKVNFKESFIKDEAKGLINLSKRLFIKDDLNIPTHVVIIPDGNRRWARARGWLPYVGHRKAINSNKLESMFEECKEFGIKYLSFWGFSTENWDRDPKEIKEIFNIINKMLPKLKDYFHKNKVRFRHLGRKDRLPNELMKTMRDLENETKMYKNLNFQLCLDYGGRNSIVEAVNRILKEGLTEVTEQDLVSHLESSELPDPDLIIRTSGEKRTSGIMAFEGVYAELYFTNVMFPDFDANEFQRAVLDYSARTRRFGGTNINDLKNINPNLLTDPDA